MMLCPTCLSIMRCESEIHDIPNLPEVKRMDLHCFNREKEKINYNNSFYNMAALTCSSHMGVILVGHKPWICHEYNFHLKYENKTYKLSGYDYAVDPRYQNRDPHIKETRIFNNSYKPLLSTNFIPISTGDDMHNEVWSVFKKLKKLIVFS